MVDDVNLQTGGDSGTATDDGPPEGPGDGWSDRLARWAEQLDPLTFDADKVRKVVAQVHDAQRLLDGVLVRCADRSRDLEDSGTGPPAEEAVAGGGAVKAIVARDLVAASRIADAFPALGEVIRGGRARPGSVTAVARLWRRLSGDEQQVFVDRFDEELADSIVELAPDIFTTLVQRRGRSVRIDDGLAESERERAANTISRRRQADGRYRYTLDIDPLTDEEIWSAIDARAWQTLRRHEDVEERRRVDDGLRAEALCDLVRSGAADDRRGIPRSYSLGIIVDHLSLIDQHAHAGTVCETDRGSPVPLGLLHRYACDAVAESYHLDGSGRPFDLGRSRRTASTRQKRALRMQYGACPLSGTPLVDCEIHHLQFWEEGGATDQENLIPLSRRWHHLVHDKKWRIDRTDGGGLAVYRPDGRLHRTVSPPIPVTRQDDGQRRRAA